MEHKRTITSEHKLHVDRQWLTKKKKSEELQDVVHTLHFQQIGEDKITVKQSIDKYGNLIDKPTIETSKDFDIASFKTEWESGWNPEIEPTRFFSSWSIEVFIDLVVVILLLALHIYVFYLYPIISCFYHFFAILFFIHFIHRNVVHCCDFIYLPKKI